VRITQGAFSFLPDLTEDQIKTQVEFILAAGFAISIEWTDDPHPRNCYWDMWGLPLFDCKDPATVMYEIAECIKANPAGYTKIQAFNPARGVESCASAFIVNRPSNEPGFELGRTEVAGRFQRYHILGYAQNGSPGERY